MVCCARQLPPSRVRLVSSQKKILPAIVWAHCKSMAGFGPREACQACREAQGRLFLAWLRCYPNGSTFARLAGPVCCWNKEACESQGRLGSAFSQVLTLLACQAEKIQEEEAVVLRSPIPACPERIACLPGRLKRLTSHCRLGVISTCQSTGPCFLQGHVWLSVP